MDHGISGSIQNLVLNFKPQYLLNYSNPINDSWCVRKKTIRAFNLIFGGPLASPHWLRTLRQNFARIVSLIAFRHASKHAIATLTQSSYQWDKVAINESCKNEKSALIFLIFWSRFLNFWDIKSIVWHQVKKRAMICNIVWKSYSRVFCIIQ